MHVTGSHVFLPGLPWVISELRGNVWVLLLRLEQFDDALNACHWTSLAPFKR